MYRKNKLYKIMLVILVMGLVLMGCNSTKQIDKVEENLGGDVKESVYPLRIVDSYDNEVVLNELPKKVISIAPSITETIFALGVENRIIGRTSFCDFPLEVENIEIIGSMRSPNIEKIIELQPDLIIASTHFENEVYDKFIELGINILVLDPRNSFDGVYDMIEKLGQVFNVTQDANVLISEMKLRVDQVMNKVKDQPKPIVYYVVGFGEHGDFTAGGGTFISDMIEMVGGINAAKDVEGWKYNIERLIEQDPDILIVSKYNDFKEGIILANGYNELTAIKEGRLFEIDNNTLDRQGPRLVLGLEELAKIIHPNLFK